MAQGLVRRGTGTWSGALHGVNHPLEEGERLEVARAKLGSNLLDQGLADLRAILDGLTPEDSTVEALPHTIERLAGRCEAGGEVRVDVRVSGDRSRRLSGSQHLAAARVAQEALRNAIRHGGARHVTYEVDADDWHDVRQLCERFGLPVPPDYDRFGTLEEPHRDRPD